MKVSHILTALAASGVALTFAPIAQAITISSSGVWSRAELTIPRFSAAGVGTDTISWGVGSVPSSYEFAGNDGTEVDDSSLLIDGAFFKIGTFTHNNFPIRGATLDEADLTVSLNFDDEGTTTSSDFLFEFEHFETPNQANPCAIPGTVPLCPDQVSIPSLVSNETVTLAGAVFNLEVVGFFTDDSDPTSGTEAFTTFEEQVNSAWIVGKLSPTPDSPLPTIPLDM